MPNFSKNEIVLIRYPFSDMSAAKVRPAVVVSASNQSDDVFIVPLTSKTHKLRDGEYLLSDWNAAGLNLPSAVKRGLYTIHPTLIKKRVGRLSLQDSTQLERSLRVWLGLN